MQVVYHTYHMYRKPSMSQFCNNFKVNPEYQPVYLAWYETLNKSDCLTCQLLLSCYLSKNKQKLGLDVAVLSYFHGYLYNIYPWIFPWTCIPHISMEITWISMDILLSNIHGHLYLIFPRKLYDKISMDTLLINFHGHTFLYQFPWTLNFILS